MLKTIVRFLVVTWEHVICKIKKITPIDGSPLGLFRIKLTKYNGAPIYLSADIILEQNDNIIELHISNILLAKGVVGDATVSSDLQIVKYFRNELAILAEYLHANNLETKIKAIGGVTIHGPGIRRLGFTLYPTDNNIHNYLIFSWMKFLRWAFSHPNKVIAYKRRTTREMQKFFMPTIQFMQKYGNQL